MIHELRCPRRTTTLRLLLPGVLLLTSAVHAGSVRGQEAAPGVAQEQEEIEIRRERPSDERPRTLRFLRENQAFLRGRLDQLRTRVTWRDLGSRPLGEHELWLRGLGRAQEAAFDSLELERQRIARRTLLQRLEELGRIEEQLDRIESLLADQEDRLEAVEADYVGRQETALALLATGLPADDAVALHVSPLDGESLRVALDATTRDVLAAGAVAELLHDFVEPRRTRLQLAVELPDGAVRPLGSIEFVPARDRLTFVQVDLDPDRDDRSSDDRLPHRVWER